jgi:hypothetical protein
MAEADDSRRQSTIRLFGVEHDEYSVSETKEELASFISEDTEVIFFEAPNDDNLREGEGIPEPGYHMTSFFWRPFLRNPSFVIYLLLVGLIPNLLKELYRERTLASLNPWTWKVGRRIVSEWNAATDLADQRGIPLIKVDKPMSDVICDQENHWTPLSVIFLVGLLLVLGYIAWIAAIGSVIVMWVYLAFFLVFLVIARFKGYTVNWRQVAVAVGVYFLLILLASYFVVEGPKLGAYIIAELATITVLYVLAIMTLRVCIYLPFIKATNDERNTYMMQQIIETAQEEDYTDVCVVIGASHLDHFEDPCDIRDVTCPEPVDMRTWD